MSKLTFAGVGDCIIAHRLRERKDGAFTDLVELIRGADVAFANFEIVTPRYPQVPSSENGMPNLMAPDWVIDELTWMGFNLFNVANNHSGDYMYTGFVDTLEAFERRGLTYAGGGRNLGEARSPGYLEISSGRAALLGAAVNFSAGSLAAPARADVSGRPGLSPLRVDREFVLDAESFAALKRIDEKIGTAAVTERRRQAGNLRNVKEGAVQFLGMNFFPGEGFEFRQIPNSKDMDDICKWISSAKRLCDFVVMSLHVHSGKNGDGNNFDMAEFIPEVAHQLVDAGADVFAGHGPHLLRPIEIYKGKPIFYSLGNFIFQLEGIRRMPAEQYELHGLGQDNTPGDFADAREWDKNGDLIAFPKGDQFYETVLPICEFEDRVLRKMDLYPVVLGRTASRSRRGFPYLADAEKGRQILEFMNRASEPFGVSIVVEPSTHGVVGRCKWL